jgi:hypothetical protein
MLKKFHAFVSLSVLLAGASVQAAEPVTAADELDGYGLYYIEREPGIDEYEVKVTVSDRYVRVDEGTGESGYIIYDDKEQVIYSVSHHDRSVLVIRATPFTDDKIPVKAVVEYLELADAPQVDGKQIYNYRVHPLKSEDETCTELQLVEGLLPEVRKILKRFQLVISGQQVSLTDNVIDEMRDACYYIDQIYNAGDYYDKGLPIQEWRSNERSRILTSYKKEKVKQGLFEIPEDYRQFSIDKESRTPLG